MGKRKVSVAGRPGPGRSFNRTKVGELQREENDARRGRRRIERLQEFRGRKVGGRGRGCGGLRNACWLREQKNYRSTPGRAALVAAGDRTGNEGIVAVMAAVLRRFRSCGLMLMGWALLWMPVGRAKAATAANHTLRLPCRSVDGRPQEHRCQQTHPCAEYSSRSDRKMARRFHQAEHKF